jgi:hypothetical protein
MIENRKHPRYPVELDCELITGGACIRGRSKNISQTGIACVVPSPIEVSSVVTLTLALAFGANAFSEPLALQATIVWCTPVGDGYQVGAKFADLTPQLRGFLEVFAHYLER